MLDTSKELAVLSKISVDEEVILNIPDSLKVKFFDDILKDTDNNICLQFLTTEYIGMTLLRVYNKTSALCIFNRTLRSSISLVPGEHCKESFYERITRIVDKIGLAKCPHGGSCELNCRHRFKLNEDFLSQITPSMKVSLYDKIVKHFMEEKNACYLSFVMILLLRYLIDRALFKKAEQLENIIYDTIPNMMESTCRTKMRKVVNSINNLKNS